MVSQERLNRQPPDLDTNLNMKKCPTCDREFDDAMRFCQTDGTPLVDAPPPVDPYKTMVARPEDIAAAMPPAASSKESGGSDPVESGSGEEVLDLPADDPKKTMYASEEEIRSAMAEVDQPVVDLPPAADAPEPAPEAPAFTADSDTQDSVFSKTSPPIPSPFGQTPSKPEPQEEASKAAEGQPPPPFAQAEPPSPGFNPFSEPSSPAEEAPMVQAQWTPPPAANDQVRREEKMQNPQYQPGSAVPAAGGQNKVLPIVSLIFGILSLCCYFAPLTGLVALITGFLGMKNANNDPANYGGKPLAIVGMVLGGLLFLLGLAYYVFLLFFGGMGMMMEMMNQAGR